MTIQWQDIGGEKHAIVDGHSLLVFGLTMQQKYGLAIDERRIGVADTMDQALERLETHARNQGWLS